MILVAGGTGRLGTLIVARLAARHMEVRVLTRDPQRAVHLGGGVSVVTGDIRDPSAVASAMEDVDVVVSAVHGFVGPRGETPATIDRDGNANLIDAAKTSGAHLVLMSVVGAAPDSPMELFRMKHAAEQHAVGSGVPTTTVRSTAFAELWIELLRSTAARSGRPLVFGRGDNPINFVSAVDVAALVERAVVDPASRGKTIEIGGPDNLTFNQLARAVQEADARTGQPRHVPTGVLRVMADTVGRIKPQAGRQARAAIAMDSVDLTFDAAATRRAYPDVPCTTVAEVLAVGARLGA